MPCTHCQHPTGLGGAKGLCARCYRYQHRNGKLPPVERLRSHGLTDVLPAVNVDPLLGAYIRADAKAAGVKIGQWIRIACHERALRQRARERQG